MGRSLKKGPFVDEKLFQKVMKQQGGSREPIKTYDEFGGRLVDYALAEQARVRATG